MNAHTRKQQPAQDAALVKLDNAALHLKGAADALDWLESLFHAMQVLSEADPSQNQQHLTRLAKLGAYVAREHSDVAGYENEVAREFLGELPSGNASGVQA